ncbi:MAG TPA: hypothetical protein EYH32_08260 [Anaerolineae bacterium]|nr:hypothetical protein [Anaerolineae bacterium]
MKAIRVDPILHMEFKSECALRGVTMAEAAGDALRALMAWWEVGVPLTLSEFIASAGRERLHSLAHELEAIRETQPD